MLDLRGCMGFSLVVASGGSSLVAVLRLLIAVAFFVVGHGLWSTGLIVVAYGLSCSVVYGFFLNQGSNPCLLHWWADSLPLSH